jgi:CspA family cold shock protein
VKEIQWLQVKLSGSTQVKGFGFIQPEEGGADVFVHISALERAGISDLKEGQRVSFELASNKGKTSAANLQLIDAA